MKLGCLVKPETKPLYRKDISIDTILNRSLNIESNFAIRNSYIMKCLPSTLKLSSRSMFGLKKANNKLVKQLFFSFLLMSSYVLLTKNRFHFIPSRFINICRKLLCRHRVFERPDWWHEVTYSNIKQAQIVK